MEPTYVMWIETADGQQVKAFTWTRDKETGMLRAKREAKEFGYGDVKVIAVPIEKAEA